MSGTGDGPQPERGTPVGRRVVLGLLALGAVGVAGGSTFQRWFDDHLGPTVRATGLGPIVPIDRWRYYTVTGSFPAAHRYRLRVSGLVDEPLRLTFAELTALPATDLTRDFQCVTGWRVTDVPWRGVLLRDLLDRAAAHVALGPLAVQPVLGAAGDHDGRVGAHESASRSAARARRFAAPLRWRGMCTTRQEALRSR